MSDDNITRLPFPVVSFNTVLDGLKDSVVQDLLADPEAIRGPAGPPGPPGPPAGDFTITWGTRATFINANLPQGLLRAGFVVQGRTFFVTRDTNGPIAQANGERWRPDGATMPQHFGDCGNDPSRDDAPVIQQALAYVADQDNAHLHFPTSWYFCRTLAEHTYDSSLENNTRITGEFPTSIIVGANHSGAMRLVNSGVARRSRFVAEGLNFVPAVAGAGCAFYVRQNPGGAELSRAAFVKYCQAVPMATFGPGHPMWHPDFEETELQFWGADPTHGDWDPPWPIPGDPDFDDVDDNWADIDDPLHPANPDVRLTDPNCVSEMAFIGMGRILVENVLLGEGGNQKPNKVRGYATLNIDGCYNPLIKSCARLNSYNYFGVTNHRVGEQEGGRMHFTNCVGAVVALAVWQSVPLENQDPLSPRFGSGNRHPVFNMFNTHLNGRRMNALFFNCKYVNLHNVWMYAQQHHTDLDNNGNYRAEPPNFFDDFIDILFVGSHACTVNNVAFRQGPHPTRNHIKLMDCRGMELNLDENSLNAQVGSSGYVVYVDEDCEDITIRMPDKTRTFDNTDYTDRRLVFVEPGAQNVRRVTPTAVHAYNNETVTQALVRNAALGTGLETIGQVDFKATRSGVNTVLDPVASLRARVQNYGQNNVRGRIQVEALEGTSGGDGLQVQARIEPTYTDGEAALFLRVRTGGAYTLERVRVGPNGSGPGGVGRALFISDA